MRLGLVLTTCRDQPDATTSATDCPQVRGSADGTGAWNTELGPAFAGPAAYTTLTINSLRKGIWI